MFEANGHFALQWGRREITAEIVTLPPSPSLGGRLQWGRREITAEIGILRAFR